MLSNKKQIIFLFISVFVFVALLFSIYREVRKQTIRELNSRQMVYAELAANGIEESFDQHFKILNYLAHEEHIIRLNSHGIKLIKSFKKMSSDEILGVTRLDAQGRIIYSYPDDINRVGTDLSKQEHIREILQTKKPVVSDVFTAVQGFKAIAIHVPVYRGSTFDGTLAFLISFDTLAKKYLKDINVENAGYAWMISAKGIEIYCPVPGHTGNSVMDNCKDFPEIIAMARKMMKGEKGFTTYTFDRSGTANADRIKKHAVYMPVRIGSTFWSIVVATPEDTVLAPMKNFRNQITIIILILLIVFTAIAYTIARMQSAAVEQQKRRRIEDALIKSAEEINDLYHNAPCGYHSIDSNGNIVRINDTELAWLGYSREEIIGKPYKRFLSNASRDQFSTVFARLKEQGLVHDVEYDMIRKDGSSLPVLVTASAIRDAQGNFVMSRSMAMDITLRREQEERLRESEILYRTALESTSDGVTIVRDGKYIYVSQRLLNTIGRPDLNLIGTTQGCFVHPDDWAELTEIYQHRRKGDPVYTDYELRVIKPDQSIVYLHVNAVIVIYHGKHAILSFIMDITRQKRIENALRESEELYRTAIENTSDGISIVDIQTGKYLYVNHRLMDTLGRPGESVIGKSIDGYIHPDDRGLSRACFKARKKGDVNAAHYEVRAFRPDGVMIMLSVTATEIIYQGQPAVISFVTDITQQKRTENALRESEELYRTAIENTSDGVSILQDGKYIYVNQKFLDTLNVTRDAIINQPLGVLAGPEAREGLKEFLDRHPRDASLHDTYITRALRPDGSSIYLQSSSVDIIYQGKPSILTFIQDITERKKAEQALRESEELYRTAMEKTNDGISIVQDGKYVYVNQKLLKTIGREEAEVVNQPLGIYMFPDDLEKVNQYFIARVQGEDAPASYDVRVIKPDDSCVTLNIKAVRITYQGKPATISFVTNVTEQKRAEEALRRSEERYRTIIESIEDDYFETDLDGNITFFNKPISCVGVNREEFMGSKHTEFMKPEMAERIYKTFRQVYFSGLPVRMVNYEFIRTDGGISHQEMSVSLIRNEAGEPTGFRGISRNVSERFKMEEERNKLTEQLYQARKMEAIGTLAGGIAHDFNNLLMGIQGYTSLMLLELDAKHPYYEQLKSIQFLVQSGANLTRQLLGFARVGRYEVAATDLNDLISKSINIFGRTKKEISIFEKYEESIRTVEVDRGQIEQVLLNIFVNAWQAMPGGGSLYLETGNAVLDKAMADQYGLKPGHYVKVSITDTGVGMDEKTRQRIFDPFFTTKEMGRGTGLGLASAYGIVKGHGGIVTVYSEKGHGTTFNIYLPVSGRAIVSEAPAESELIGGRETILLVDDEAVITEVTGRLLKELGYRMIAAASGEEAIEIYTQKQADIDLVIIDMIMPGMSGSETFDRIKAINPSVRAMLSSGYSLNGKAKAIMDKGVRVFLQKPYRLNDLARKIREALSD